MFKKGIVDAAKVTRSALQNAASIAAMVLTTETLVTDIPEKDKGGAGGGHGHGGGGTWTSRARLFRHPARRRAGCVSPAGGSRWRRRRWPRWRRRRRPARSLRQARAGSKPTHGFGRRARCMVTISTKVSH